MRALNAGDEVFARIDRSELDAAADIARTGAERNPLSPEPLWELALVEQLRGNNFAAERALEDAVRLEPATAETWRRLGRLQLSVLNEPDEALDSFRAALYLDPRQPASTSDFLEASRAANAGCSEPRTARPTSTLPRRAAWTCTSSNANVSSVAIERASRVEAQVPAERVEVALEAGERDRRRPQPAVGRSGHEQPPTRTQHATDLRQQPGGVGDVLEHLRAPDEVDLAVGQRQRPVRRREPQIGAGGDARARSRAASATSTPTGSAPGGAQRGDEAPGAAAEVEHALARPCLGEQEPAPPGPRPRLGVGRRGGPRVLVEGAHRAARLGGPRPGVAGAPDRDGPARSDALRPDRAAA